jgi:hypothetical protein
MSAVLLLRIASVVSLLFAIGHTLGGRKKWSPMGQNDVLASMTTVHFDTMGANRSYLDFFLGFGWCLSISLFLQAGVLWQMATLAEPDAARMRPMIALFAVATLATGVIARRFIFAIPALFCAALVLLLVAAYVVA